MIREGRCCCVGCRDETFRHLLDGHRGCVVVHAKVVVHEPSPVVVHRESRHGKYRDLDARRKYRREWMARRRAEERAA